jgi:choice-of-anchor C domain-containing protein
MVKQIGKLICVSMLAAVFAVPALADNLVLDGSFETLNAGTTFATIGVGPLGSWTINTGTVDLVGSGYWQAHAGINSVDMNGVSPASISQSLNTTVGQNYALSFWISGNPDIGADLKSMDVLWGGVVIGTVNFLTAANTHANMGYIQYSFNVTASGNSTVLGFASSTQNCCWGPVVDDVTVSTNERQTPVPEPGTLVLMGTGLLGSLSGLRRKLISR